MHSFRLRILATTKMQNNMGQRGDFVRVLELGLLVSLRERRKENATLLGNDAEAAKHESEASMVPFYLCLSLD